VWNETGASLAYTVLPMYWQTGWFRGMLGLIVVAPDFVEVLFGRRWHQAAPVFQILAPIGLWMLVVGFGSGAMTLYFQITIAEASRPEERGAALALGGMGWSVSHLSTPLLMGLLADRYGIVEAFYLLGGLALTCALLIAWMRPWAFKLA